MNHATKTGDETLLNQALNILNWSLEIGRDKEYGGCTISEIYSIARANNSNTI